MVKNILLFGFIIIPRVSVQFFLIIVEDAGFWLATVTLLTFLNCPWDFGVRTAQFHVVHAGTKPHTVQLSATHRRSLTSLESGFPNSLYTP